VQPRTGIAGSAARSGNSHGPAIGTFNAMFPRLRCFAETSMLVPANVCDVRLGARFKPAQDVTVVLGWDRPSRALATDGLHGSGMVQYANTNKVTGSRVGTEPVGGCVLAD